MARPDVSASAALSAPPRRRWRRWYWLLAVCFLLGGGLAAVEGWAAWQERLARQALADDQMEVARQHIELALWVPGRRVSTLLLAARIRRLRGGYSEAEQYLERCKQADGMSEAVQLEWLLLRCQKGEVDELSSNLLTLAKRRHPEAAAILETLVSVYLRQTRYLEAMVCLSLMLEQNPDSVRGLDWRGWLNVQLDHREQAIRDYQHLLELHSERTDIRLRLAQVLVESTGQAEATPHLEQLFREQPDNPDVSIALALCRIDAGRMEEAQALLDAVLTNQPDNFDALFQRGKLELSLEHPAAAESWLLKALRIKPHDKDAIYILYRSLQGQPDRKQDAERERMRWEQETKKLERLTTLIRRELAAHPNDVELACEAGKLLLEVGEDQRGLFWLHRAVTINPHHDASRRALAAYYERTNQPDKAAEQMRQLGKEKNHESHESHE